ncbi:MAG: hypothetical protein KJ066_01845 [Acidobacteria bacterium]|nr:hypothetical protein [Acidobacteriota bacterium]
MMSVVRLIGFTTLACGCVVGRYRETATARDISYIEEKGVGCPESTHRRNQVLPRRWTAHVGSSAALSQARAS